MIDPLAPPRPSDTRPALLGGAAILAVILLWALRDLVVLAGISVLLAYALDPLVSALEPIKPGGRGLPRGLASAIVMLVMVMFAGFAIAWPPAQAVGELVKFLERAPAITTEILDRFREWATLNGFATYVDPVTEMVRTNMAAISQNAAGIIAAAAGRLFSSLGALLGVAVLPLLSFYLLAEREEVKRSAIRFLPPQMHVRVRGAAEAIDRALRSYVRGQAIVCLVMGTSVGIALALLRFPYALFLGALVGIAEIVPYLGFLLAATAIVLTGFTLGPLQAVLGLGLYALINNLVGMLITPRVMGRYLEMHPYVVTLSVLAGAKLLGPGGVLIALPLAAIMQSMISEFAQRPADELIVPK